MAIENKTFCWNGIVSTDVDATLAFFPEVLGWGVQEMEMGGDTMKMFSFNGAPIAHVRRPAMDGEPAWWNNYLRVESVDAALAAVVAHGSRVLVPATDIPVGRFATVTTPSGAAFTLFHEGSAADEGAAPGAIAWVDLHSKDLAADLGFLRGALGFETQEMAMPKGPYFILDPNGKTQAGAMAGAHPEAPSMWLAWAAVDNVDDALRRVATHGGTVVSPAWSVPGVGRLGIARDPAGVVFGVMTAG